jgi:demethylmenaquinone methyltransferase/2-methoxy-6-polyprenyl-1,4-benzoquinol methylase
MFAAIARSYDLNNRVHSFWRDQAWRRAAVRAARVRPGDEVLDVACGTGDLTQLLARTPARRVTGLDFTPAMLDLARVKQRAQPADAAGKITYVEGDAMALPYPDASFDVLTIAFGLRNVTEPARAVREFARVLRPGGRLVVLEFDTPRPPMRWITDFYCGWLMPRTATVISGDRSGAYRYLPRSVGTFVGRRGVEALMREAGFAQVASRAMTLGICTVISGERPANPATSPT